jgi:hypothetical protein
MGWKSLRRNPLAEVVGLIAFLFMMAFLFLTLAVDVKKKEQPK